LFEGGWHVGRTYFSPLIEVRTDGIVVIAAGSMCCDILRSVVHVSGCGCGCGLSLSTFEEIRCEIHEREQEGRKYALVDSNEKARDGTYVK